MVKKQKSQKIEKNEKNKKKIDKITLLKKELTQQNQQKRKSFRKIKKPKKDESFISDIDIIENLSNASKLMKSDNNSIHTISINAELIYRYTLDQIEISGEWSDPHTGLHQKLSYLLLKRDNILLPIYKYQIDYTHFDPNIPIDKYIKNDFYLFTIASCNITETLLIQNTSILSHILMFLSGQYIGYYINDSKTIEDNFYLSYIYDNFNQNEQRLIGIGKNYQGEYELLGSIRLLTSKKEMIERNSKNAKKEKEVFILGDITLKKIYHFDFESNNIKEKSKNKFDNK